MARKIVTGESVKLWLSAHDTYSWAHRSGACWPCYQFSGKRMFAEFWKGDLVDFTVNGRHDVDLDGNEFSAITGDYLNA